ncbi:TIGR04283 family arsenosugar biosynthesis glycosyltransferase [Selenihalanaerobacter shriftii]|uniref:4,4'-diaponeurosporenoate glycosyltransferase n=1 Tax=Selenihalanaerobacter shriftii TaxID=142842 RepID=A0A1T4K5P7_9FIRM|nr:TIGR04283 family arsenosugar biosynthesis glycosyltransferase [Selenihalanaerobacter shriftii]SJZ37657.1 transferase 2, rSAM/selenodomain-associated [Selenihalanaerobacter shriftii]
MSDLISVIIPVLDEESTIIETLKEVSQLSGRKEIIIVDGGSKDRTYELAEGLADKVCQTRAGRGHQMNVGAKKATGDILFFLHSDSCIEEDALLSIKSALQDPEIIGGSFSLKVDDDSLPLRFISWTSNLRAKYLKIIFGDQGVFVRSSVFHDLGGYPDIELMEDWAFSKKIAKVGKLVQLSQNIYTSARRWHKFGTWKTIFLMHKIKILYLMGVSPKKLNQIYRNAR